MGRTPSGQGFIFECVGVENQIGDFGVRIPRCFDGIGVIAGKVDPGRLFACFIEENLFALRVYHGQGLLVIIFYR